MKKTDREIYELGTLAAYDIQVKNKKVSSSVIEAMIEYHEEKRNEHAEAAATLEKSLDEYRQKESRATTQKTLLDSSKDSFVRKLINEQLKPLFSAEEIAGYRKNYLDGYDDRIISRLVNEAETRSKGNIVSGIFDYIAIGNWLIDQRGES
jgi:hypothetical protein